MVTNSNTHWLFVVNTKRVSTCDYFSH